MAEQGVKRSDSDVVDWTSDYRQQPEIWQEDEKVEAIMVSVPVGTVLQDNVKPKFDVISHEERIQHALDAYCRRVAQHKTVEYPLDFDSVAASFSKLEPVDYTAMSMAEKRQAVAAILTDHQVSTLLAINNFVTARSYGPIDVTADFEQIRPRIIQLMSAYQGLAGGWVINNSTWNLMSPGDELSKNKTVPAKTWWLVNIIHIADRNDSDLEDYLTVLSDLIDNTFPAFISSYEYAKCSRNTGRSYVIMSITRVKVPKPEGKVLEL